MSTASPLRDAGAQGARSTRSAWAPLAALLLAAAPAGARQADSGGPWTALPLPALARPAAPSALLGRLETGRCLLGPRDDPQPLEIRPPAAFEPAAVLGLLLDEVTARGLKVELHPGATPLLARGAPEQVEVLRGILRDLDALGRQLEVTLSVWVAAPDAEAFAAVSQREPDYRAVVRSGQSISFGSRTQASFLTGYAIEVAHDSGVADPLLSRAQLGRVLHVRPSRVRNGRAVHLECLLEHAQLEPEAPPFDPGTPDLGLLEQPVVRFAQARFSDVVESGAASVFTLSGSLDGWADATVWIRAETVADPEGPGASGEPAWRGLDLALFEYRVFDLPPAEPGSGLDLAAGPAGEWRILTEAFPAAQVALAAEPAGGRRRPGPLWTPGYLLLPPGGAALENARSVVAALESQRLHTARLGVVHGTLRVDMPTAQGQPARVLIGRETLRLVDYSTHVAEESWMPVPIVEPVFDGLCIQGHLDGDRLRGLAWVSETGGLRTIERADVGVGRLQLLERGFQSCPLDLTQGAPRQDGATDPAASVLGLRSTSPGLTLELHSR